MSCIRVYLQERCNIVLKLCGSLLICVNTWINNVTSDWENDYYACATIWIFFYRTVVCVLPDTYKCREKENKKLIISFLL